MGSIFDTETIIIGRTLANVSIGELLRIANQIDRINGGIYNDLYAHIWLNSTLPGYVTENQSLMPINVPPSTKAVKPSAVLKARTLSYQADLTCTSALPAPQDSCDVDFFAWGAQGEWLSNGKGCIVPKPSVGSTSITYTGWAKSGQALGLESPCCPKQFVNTFLAHYSSSDKSHVFFCETSYWTQSVNATIRLSDSTILSTQPLDPRSPLLLDAFNSTWLDTLSSVAVAAFEEFDTAYTGSWGTENADIDQCIIYNQFQRLSALRPGVGFGKDISRDALALDRTPFAEYRDMEKLVMAFRKTHQLIFGLAINNVVAQIAGQSSSSSADDSILEEESGVITISQEFVIVSQTLLCMLAILAATLSYINWRRPLDLTRDPASIANLIGVQTPSVERLLEHLPAEALPADVERTLRPQRFAMSESHIRVMPKQAVISSDYALPRGSDDETRAGPSHHFRPLELRTVTLMAFILIIMLALVVLILLRRSMHDTGISKPFSSPLGNRMLVSFLPTLLGTLLEAMWVVINRSLCYLQPLEDLRKAHNGAKRSRALHARYITLPPQLVFFQALAAKSTLLYLVCGIA